jgi:hydrocephalus-inducing protein
VANPTSQGYAFEWKQIEDSTMSNNSQHNYIKCKTPKGVILSGKKFEMVFEYLPESVGTHDSFWQFEIPSLKQVQSFYVFGQVREPNIFINTGKVNFGPLLLSGRAKE